MSGEAVNKAQKAAMWKTITSSASAVFLLVWFIVALLWPTVLSLDLKASKFIKRDVFDAFTAGGTSAAVAEAQEKQSTPAPKKLVIYVFSGSDPEYANNLRFFVREAVKVRLRQCAAA